MVFIVYMEYFNAGTKVVSTRQKYSYKNKKEIIPAVPTKAVEVVIFVPPAAPVTSSTSPFPSTKMEGTIEDNGCFFGSI